MSGLRSPIRSPLRNAVVPADDDFRFNLTNQALAVLRKFGSNAHVYLPGSTVTSYGAELVTDNWTVNSGYNNVITSHTASSVSSTASTSPTTAARIFVNFTTKIGTTYKVTATPSGNNGNAYVRAGSDGVGTILVSVAAGALSTTFVATTTNSCMLLEALGGLAMDWSGISVREVITTSSVTAGLTAGNYTLSDGSSGYSAIDGTAGLVLDAAGAVGAESITGGTFGNAGDWGLGSGWSVSGNLGVFAGTSAFSQLINTAAVAAVGSTNLVTFTVASAGANVTSVRVVLGGSFSVSRAISGPGTYSVYAVNLGASTSVAIQSLGGSSGAADAFSLSYLSCKPVTGIHATQATTANKPAVRRGLYCEIPYSQDITQWSSTAAGTITGGQADPNGGTNAQLFSGASKNVYRVIAGLAAGTPVTHAITCYSPIAGTINIGSANGTASQNVPISAGWGTYAFSWTSSLNDGPVLILNGTLSAITIYRQGFFKGTLTAAQILSEGGIPLTTASAASNSGAGRYSWQQQLASAGLTFGSVPFQITDDHCVVAGFMSASTPAANTAVVVPAATTGITRVCGILTETTGKALVTWYDGTTNNVVASASSIVGQTVVVSGRKVGSTGIGRLNGTQFGSVSVTASLTATTGAIGGFAAAGQSHIGTIGPVILIKGTVSDADLLTIERWVAANTPAGPTF